MSTSLPAAAIAAIVTASARGRWQRELARELLAGGHVRPFARLSGRARGYEARYRASWRGFLGRLTAAGVNVSSAPGPRGGEYGRSWWIDF